MTWWKRRTTPRQVTGNGTPHRRGAIDVARVTPPFKTPAVPKTCANRRNAMVYTILIVLVILMLLGAMPRWDYSRNWGYAPSGGLGLILLVLLVLLLVGRI